MEKLNFRNFFTAKFFAFFLLLVLGLLCVYQVISALLGLIILFLIISVQSKFISKILKANNLNDSSFFSFFYSLSYNIFSLAILYYVVGLDKNVFSLWLVLSFIPIIYRSIIKREQVSFYYLKVKIIELVDEFRLIANNIFSSSALILIIFLLAYFYFNPITNGSPSPWVNASWLVFPAFFLLVLFIIMSAINKKNYTLINFSFLFLIISLVSLKYQMAYGFDSMLHQAALDHIMQYGQITPLTPFYIGQYVLEILIKIFTGLNFLIIERFFSPLLFVLMTYIAGKHFLKINSSSLVPLSLVPISILLLIPNQFIYSSPYAFSLLWAIISIMAFYSFLKNSNYSEYFFSLIAILTSLIIHPFVALNILPWILAGPWLKKLTPVKKILLLVMLIVISSLLVAFSFGIYNWLKGSAIYLNNPSLYIQNFFNLFGDPHWYFKSGASFKLWFLYSYEKISLVFIILILALYSFIKKNKLTGNIFFFLTFLLWLVFFYSQAQFLFILLSIILYIFLNRKGDKSNTTILLVSFSSLLAAYFFFSIIQVSGYSDSDQINYSSRLLQTAKWLLWPVVLLMLSELFDLVNRKNKIFKYIFALCLALVLTANWYLTYPRNDFISRINVNNIGAVDYQALDYIYNQEGGKTGYIVLANQLFGAAAVQKYGFGPYLKTKSGQVLYYSIPMGGDLNNAFEKIMSSKNFDRSIIEKLFKDVDVEKIYLITTYYWPLYPPAAIQVQNYATSYKNIDNKINIYQFTHVK